MNWYQYTKTQLEQEFKVNLQTGLARGEAAARNKEHGFNLLPEKAPESWMVIFLRQIKSPLIYLLLVCAVIIYYLRESTDAYIILAVLLVNAIIGAFQEGRAGQMLRSLKNLAAVDATVLRGGQEVMVPESEVTIGALGAVVDRLRLRDLAVRPLLDAVRRSESHRDCLEILRDGVFSFLHRSGLVRGAPSRHW
jgi:Ca2+-transporting ATPase